MSEFDSSKWTGTGSAADDIRKLLKGKTLRQRGSEAYKWFSNKIRGAASAQKNQIGNLPKTKDAIIALKQRQTKTSSLGQMYFFVYDPKHKKTLPYYDKFPLIFPINTYDDGFLGINLHYLDIRSRARLLQQLKSLANNKRYDETTKLKISYSILQGTGKLFEPCVKRYLSNHVKSKFIRVDASEWDDAIFLPVEAFEKAPASRVWRESRKRTK